MLKSTLFFTLFCSLFITEFANARKGNGGGRQRYTVEINNYRGRNYEWTELGIKDLLRSHYSVQLRGATLLEVELEASPYNGPAGVDLLVGNTVVDSASMKRGKRHRWNRRQDQSLMLRNYNNNQDKYWGLDIRGSLHIRSITVHLKHRRHSQGRPGKDRIVSLGTQKIQKNFLSFLGQDSHSTYTFHANGLWARGMRIFSTKKEVSVVSVRLRTQDGRERLISGANRKYNEGEDPVEIFFSEENIDAVIVEANSPNIRGSRGILEIELFSR